jgi:hypothetical protein
LETSLNIEESKIVILDLNSGLFRGRFISRIDNGRNLGTILFEFLDLLDDFRNHGETRENKLLPSVTRIYDFLKHAHNNLSWDGFVARHILVELKSKVSLSSLLLRN